MRTMPPPFLHRYGVIQRWHGQRGITLVVALLVLVSMTLAGLALIRSVDSGTLVAGNLAFRQSATASGDQGIETAIAALRGLGATPANLESDSSGYFASLPASAVDFTGNLTPSSASDDFDWAGDAIEVATPDAAGNTYEYVIHRLCQSAGKLDETTCTTWRDVIDDDGAGKGVLVPVENYRGENLKPHDPDPRGIYRITVRVTGPRNTHSYLQASVVL